MECEPLSGLSTRELGAHIGIEVCGLDVTRMTSEQTGTLKALLAKYLVVVIRDQDLSPNAQIAFTELFGSAVVHPLKTHRDAQFPELLVLRNDPDNPGRRNDLWHSDVSFDLTPSAIGILHARLVPPGRGDTLFANMYRVFDNLSKKLRESLEGLYAVHRADHEVLTRTPGVTKENLADHLPAGVAHPVVRKHSFTERPCLFINPYYVRHFSSFSAAESAPLIQYLCAQATMPENLYRHRWRQGDLLLFDNQATMHYAVHDYDATMPRLMHRTSVSGDRPTGWSSAQA